MLNRSRGQHIASEWWASGLIACPQTFGVAHGGLTSELSAGDSEVHAPAQRDLLKPLIDGIGQHEQNINVPDWAHARQLSPGPNQHRVDVPARDAIVVRLFLEASLKVPQFSGSRAANLGQSQRPILPR